MENERKNGAILAYLSLFVTTIVTLVYNRFMTRMLGQSEYGLYSMVASVISYLSVLDLGFGNAIIVYTAKYRNEGKYEAEKKLHGMFSIVFIVMGLIVALFGLIFYFNVDNLFGATMTATELKKAKIMMLILVVNLAITFPFSIYNSIITAYEKFTFQKVLSICVSLLGPIIMIPLLFMGYKSITMVIILSLVNLVSYICNFLYCRKKLNITIKFCGFDFKLLKEMLGYSIFIFLGVVVDKINWSVDNFILGAVSGTNQVALYSFASQFNSLFIALSSALSGVMLPKMAKMVSSKATDKELSNEFIKIGRLQYLLIFLVLTGFILFGKDFIVWLAGEEYTISYYIALILIIPLSIPLIQNIGISIMQAKNLHKFRAILLFLIAIANIFVSIPLAKNYGGVGAAIGTSLSLIIGNIIIVNIYYQIKVGIDVISFWKEIIKMTVYLLMPFIIVLFLISIFDFTGILKMLIFGCIYVLLYVIFAYFLVINDYEKKLFYSLLIKFRRC